MRRLGRLISLTIWVVTLSCAAGCGASRKSALADDTPAQPSVDGDFDAVVARGDAHWKKRVDRDQVDAAIAAWTRATNIDLSDRPDDVRRPQLAAVYEDLAEAYFLLGYTHIRLNVSDNSDRDSAMKQAHEHGMTAAEKAIKLRAPEFAAHVAQGDPWGEHLDQVDPSAVAGLYWYAVNLGKWGMLEGPATMLARKNDLEAIMQYICDTRESFNYGACHRFFGVYWTKLPFSSDAQKSKAHFDKAIEIAPNFLANKMLEARDYATLANKRKLYDQLLDDVVATPTDALPEAAAENHFAQKKARQLQQHAGKYFE